MGGRRKYHAFLVSCMSLKTTLDELVGRLPVRYQNIARQFLKFGVTGVVGAIVDFSIYGFLTRVIGWTAFYTVFGFQIVAANNVSVFCAIMSNFFINKYWTFKNREGNVAKQWLGYFSFNAVTWVMNQILVSYFVFHVALFDQLFGHNSDLAAKVAAIGIILFINFFGSKFLVFKTKKS